MDDLTKERFGVLPTAELYRRPVWLHDCGGPDTPEAIARRRRELLDAMDDGWDRNRKAAA